MLGQTNHTGLRTGCKLLSWSVLGFRIQWFIWFSKHRIPIPLCVPFCGCLSSRCQTRTYKSCHHCTPRFVVFFVRGTPLGCAPVACGMMSLAPSKTPIVAFRFKAQATWSIIHLSAKFEHWTPWQVPLPHTNPLWHAPAASQGLSGRGGRALVNGLWVCIVAV